MRYNPQGKKKISLEIVYNEMDLVSRYIYKLLIFYVYIYI